MGIFDNFLDDQKTVGLLGLAGGLLNAGGPSLRPTSFGQALGQGLQGMQGATSALRNRQRDDEQYGLQKQMQGMKLKGMQDESASAEMLKQAAQSSLGPDGQFDPAVFVSKVREFDPLKAQEYARSLAPKVPKYSNEMTFVNGPDGKPVVVRLADDGSYKTLDGFAPRDKMDTLNLGGSEVVVNPYALTPGQKFTRTQTPDSVASQAVQMRGQNMTDSRAREANNNGKAPAGYQWSPDGKALMPIPGGPAAVGKAPTEFQGKSAAFGLRAREADKIISSLGGNYNPLAINAKQSVQDWPLIGGAIGAATNSMALTENDQMAEQAQRDFVNAVLRQESGAAIGADEFANAKRQYFPQPGDKPANIAQKARNRQLAIQGFDSNAGHAVMKAPPKAGGWSIKKVD